MAITLGVDIGGTFTDFVWAKDGALRVLKLPTTPAQEEAFLALNSSRNFAKPPQLGELDGGKTAFSFDPLEEPGSRLSEALVAAFPSNQNALDRVPPRSSLNKASHAS